jgi:hypothetical protein
MYTLLTVIRKKPEISTEDFRHFMKHDYGPTYQQLPQTREYIQYFVSDLATDDAEPPIDAIVRISFDSETALHEALQTEAYKKAHDLRQAYLRETSTGIHTAVLDETNQLV